MVEGFRTGADSFATKTKAVGKGPFDAEWVAAVIMEVLLLVGGFDVDRRVKLAIGQVEVNVKESGKGFGVGPGVSDGTKGVEVGEEILESFFTVSPDHENVINKSVPNFGLAGLGNQEGFL
ncbi:uncharacterized protein LOC126088159 [Schistocerca cancellata]|uniref:uncharacterized protein LOC126088159 n=1 Tax=Schistocerca cancellata TaxID=274614 RepID=UPI002118D031|nr:uncharacterized protein LOC126088159 [Schistocerca cancellata]